MTTATKPAEECLETYGAAMFALYNLRAHGRADLAELAMETSKRLADEDNIDLNDYPLPGDYEPRDHWGEGR